MPQSTTKSIVSALLTGITISQPAIAADTVITCKGTSNMTIYNPHGKGGTIGGPTDKSWTIKVIDANTASITTEGDKGAVTFEAANVEVNQTGLSYCVVGEGYQCDVPKFKSGSDGFMRKTLMTRTTISPGGEYFSHFAAMTTNAAMRTGVEILETGQCDRAGMAAVMHLANGNNIAPPKAPAAGETR